MNVEVEIPVVPPLVHNRENCLLERAKLHPVLFYGRVGEWVRGGLPAQSINEGVRSSSRALPSLDRADENVLRLASRYAQHLRHGDRQFLASRFEPAWVGYRAAVAIESGVLPELHMSTAALIEWRREMSRQADEEASLRNMRAVKCSNVNHPTDRWVERTKDDPLCSGRCYDCYQTWKRTGIDPTTEQITALAEKREGKAEAS